MSVGAGRPAFQKRRKRATVTSYASIANGETVIASWSGVAFVVPISPIANVPPGIATAPPPSSGAGQLGGPTQTPLSHASPTSQGTPHAPQCAGSASVATSHPSSGSLL